MCYCLVMEKIINKFIKDVEIYDDALDNLNKKIEENFINSKILFVVDFLTYQKNYLRFEEIKKCSLNSIIIKVFYNFKKAEKEYKLLLDETVSLVVGIGDFNAVNFTKEFAIKNNINFALVSINNLKCEIFAKKSANLSQKTEISPIFILINKQTVTNKILFDLTTNLYKYNYILFDDKFNEIKKDYINIILGITKENIVNKIIAFGLILNKFNITYFLNSNNDFKNLLNTQLLIITYKNLFLNMNKNNLTKINSLNFLTRNEIFSYINFDEKFLRFYLLASKNILLTKAVNLFNLNLKLINNLKQIDIFTFYKYSKYLKVDNSKSEKLNIDFLENLKYFKMFNNVYKIFA